MTNLSDRDQLFISQYLSAGCSGQRAMILLGSSPRNASKAANKMLARDEIQAELQRRMQEIATGASVTVESLIKEAEEARAVAQATGASGAMTQAITLKARLSGHLSDRPNPAESKTGDIILMISADDARLF